MQTKFLKANLALLSRERRGPYGKGVDVSSTMSPGLLAQRSLCHHVDVLIWVASHLTSTETADAWPDWAWRGSVPSTLSLKVRFKVYSELEGSVVKAPRGTCTTAQRRRLLLAGRQPCACEPSHSRTGRAPLASGERAHEARASQLSQLGAICAPVPPPLPRDEE